MVLDLIGAAEAVLRPHTVGDRLFGDVAAALDTASGQRLDGILAAVLISGLTLLYETGCQPVEVLDSVPGESTSTQPIPPGMVILRPHSDIYFANAQSFRSQVQAALDNAATPPSVLLVDATRLSIFEYTAHQAVREMMTDLDAEAIEIWAIVPGREHPRRDRSLRSNPRIPTGHPLHGHD